MKHSEFTDKFHWMNGLSEYFRYTGQEERYEPIFKALYHNNYYRKRDILWQMIKQDGIDLTDVPDELARAWVNMLLNEHFDDIEVKPELITSFLATYSGDPFVKRICNFIDYFLFDHDTDLLLPDLGDFLSRGQVKSKLWMADELKKIVDGPLGNVVFYGGWYNFMAHFLFQNFDVNTVISIDLDENVVEPSKRLYQTEYKEHKFIPMVGDAGKLEWDGRRLMFVDQERRQEMIDEWTSNNQEKIKQYSIDKEKVFANFGWRNVFANEERLAIVEKMDIEDFKKHKIQSDLHKQQINCVINTSCEHMDNTWFKKLPMGTLVVLQQNDYFENPQHVNCCRDLEDVKSKYPMSEFLYTGELDTYLYNRFMLIGIK